MIALAVLPVLAQTPSAEIEVVGWADPGPTTVRVADVARPGEGLSDVLRTVPGVHIRQLGGLGAFAGISLRGTSFRQTLVRLDGVPLNPDGVAAIDLSQLPLAGLATVSVTRGRPPATVGAAPIGGVVDLATAGASPLTHAEAAVGSFRAARTSLAVARSGSVDGLVAADAFATGGGFSYLDDNGTRFVFDDDQFRTRTDNQRVQASLLARLRGGPPRRRVTGLVTGVLRDEGLPGAIGFPLADVGLTTGRGLASLGVSSTGRRRTGRVQTYAILRRERLRDPQGELGRIDTVQRDRFDTFGVTASGQVGVGRHVVVRGSVEGRHEAFARRTEALEPGGRRMGTAAALDAPIALADRRVVLTPGVDVRGLFVRFPDRDAAGAVLPGIGVVVAGDRPHAAFASVTTGFRPPDLTELYGDRATLVGNPDLRPERGTKAEIGGRLAHDGALFVQVEAAVSASAARDAIGWLQNTQRTVIAVNFGRTRTLGAELGGRVAVGDPDEAGAGLAASVTWLDARQTTDDPTRFGRPVPFVAPWRQWARGFARVPPFELQVDIDHTAPIPVDPQGITLQPSRTLIGVALVASVSVVDLAVRIDNLFDVRTGTVDQDPFSPQDTRAPAPITDFIGYPLPGRTVFGSVRITAPRRKS